MSGNPDIWIRARKITEDFLETGPRAYKRQSTVSFLVPQYNLF